MPSLQTSWNDALTAYNEIEIGFSASHAILGLNPGLLLERAQAGLGNTREFLALARRLESTDEPLNAIERARLEHLLTLAEAGTLQEEIGTLPRILTGARSSGATPMFGPSDPTRQGALTRFHHGIRAIPEAISNLAADVRAVLHGPVQPR
ncbi:MAG: hypothetical protein Q8R79_02845, partial [Legionellaceae bacterium]|nr:hypothetical protein [Legionellaceae bacterium]